MPSEAYPFQVALKSPTAEVTVRTLVPSASKGSEETLSADGGPATWVDRMVAIRCPELSKTRRLRT